MISERSIGNILGDCKYCAVVEEASVGDKGDGKEYRQQCEGDDDSIKIIGRGLIFCRYLFSWTHTQASQNLQKSVKPQQLSQIL